MLERALKKGEKIKIIGLQCFGIGTSFLTEVAQIGLSAASVRGFQRQDRELDREQASSDTCTSVASATPVVLVSGGLVL